MEVWAVTWYTDSGMEYREFSSFAAAAKFASHKKAEGLFDCMWKIE